VIRLEQLAENNVILTLTENKVGTSNYYLIECTNQVTNDIAYSIISNDLSAYKERYNSFDIILDLNNDDKGLNNHIYLPYSGFYTYVVIETSLTLNQYNSLTKAEDALPYILGQLETGLLWLIPDATNNTEYNPADSTTFVYTPQ
jgi:hypothetical protein